MIDEVAETYLVMEALDNLSQQDDMWDKNRLVYERMTPTKRIWWWRMAKANANAGIPAMQLLLTNVITLRLTKNGLLNHNP